MNECLTDFTLCSTMAHGVCVDTYGSSTCGCVDGYELKPNPINPEQFYCESEYTFSLTSCHWLSLSLEWKICICTDIFFFHSTELITGGKVTSE